MDHELSPEERMQAHQLLKAGDSNLPPPPGPFDVLLNSEKGLERAGDLLKLFRDDCGKFEESFTKAVTVLGTTAAVLLILLSTPLADLDFLGIRFSEKSEGTVLCLLACLLSATQYFAITRWMLMRDSGIHFAVLFAKLYPEVRDHFAVASINPPSLMKAERLINRRLPMLPRDTVFRFLIFNQLLLVVIVLLFYAPYVLTYVTFDHVYKQYGLNHLFSVLSMIVVGVCELQSLALTIAAFRFDKWETTYRSDSQKIFAHTMSVAEKVIGDGLSKIRSSARPLEVAKSCIDDFRRAASVLEEFSTERALQISSEEIKLVVSWCRAEDSISWRDGFVRALVTHPMPLP
jgi:hypothetical protein